MIFERLGRFTFKHRRIVILVWILLVIPGAILAPTVNEHMSHGAYTTSSGEAVEGANILESELGIRYNSMLVVFASDTIRADDPQFMDEMDQALAGIQDIEGLDAPITYRNTNDPSLISADGHTTYAVLGINGDVHEATKLVPDVRDGLEPQSHLTMHVTGRAPFHVDGEAVATEDLAKAEKYTFPLVAIVLILVFGSLVAAGLPLVVGGASIAMTMGLVFIVSQYIDMTTACLSVISFVGLGLAIDFSLIMVSRFREEVREGHGIEQAVVTTVSTSGKAIFYSAATSMIGFAAMISFKADMARCFGISGLLVVMLTLALGVTLVPALLSVLGSSINRLTLFRLPERGGTFWQRLARWEMRHPVPVLVVVGLVLGLLIWPVTSLSTAGATFSDYPDHTPSKQGYDILVEGFGAGEISPIPVVITTNAGSVLDAKNAGALYDCTRDIAQSDDVRRVESIVDIAPSITKEQYQFMYAAPEAIPDSTIRQSLEEFTSDTTTVIHVYGHGELGSKKAEELVSYLRGFEIDDLQLYVTGTDAEMKDVADQMYSQFPLVFLIIMVLSYLSLLWLFRSVLLPLKAILLNAASVAAAFGVIVFVFQEGHFSSVLGFTPMDSIDAILPIIIFCVVFGLSMDYEVFLLTRCKEIWCETKDNTTAVALGLERTAGVIISAALIMIVVFGSFAVTELSYTKIIGVGLAMAILVDVAIIRVFFAPALMRILGKWNWWAPSFIQGSQSTNDAGKAE